MLFFDIYDDYFKTFFIALLHTVLSFFKTPKFENALFVDGSLSRF